ncbi:hypothetical protein GCM10010106_51300 [Thermopolyspora flexuosa]|nr:hypothetical protein GCM10010106_51300 [Thermopolyspora flexuosa]
MVMLMWAYLSLLVRKDSQHDCRRTKEGNSREETSVGVCRDSGTDTTGRRGEGSARGKEKEAQPLFQCR